jgi:hypothetical protein
MDQAFRNPLAQGSYSVPEAARLVRVGGARRIYGWLQGHAGRCVGPLLERDDHPVGDTEELSFHHLMEVRFVEHFRGRDVKVRRPRIAASRLRDELEIKYSYECRTGDARWVPFEKKLGNIAKAAQPSAGCREGY